MKKIYLVDSENVGDIWVPLLVSSQKEDQVLVFYTQKSPHMNYENVRMLKETEKEAVFIKCFEGSNALDFQLVTELGYMLRGDADCEYVIVSNDTGFDAAVRYWAARKMPVRRLSGKECYRQVTGKKPLLQKKEKPEEKPAEIQENEQPEPDVELVAEPAEKAAENELRTKTDMESAEGMQPEPDVQPGKEMQPEPDVQLKQGLQSKTDMGAVSTLKPEMEAEADTAEELQAELYADAEGVLQAEAEPEAEADPQTEEEQPFKMDAAEVTENSLPAVLELSEEAEKIVRALCCCISKDNLADFHNALVMFLGEEEGKELYQEIKGSPEWTLYWAGQPECSPKEKFDVYCRMVFEHSELADDYPKDFSGFLLKANGKRKNLNSLRAALQGQYGKEKGMKYYSLFKSHIKIMNRM